MTERRRMTAEEMARRDSREVQIAVGRLENIRYGRRSDETSAYGWLRSQLASLWRTSDTFVDAHAAKAVTADERFTAVANAFAERLENAGESPAWMVDAWTLVTESQMQDALTDVNASDRFVEAADAYWFGGSAYCVECVEGDTPCLGNDEIARATRSPGQGQCGCCHTAF